jgi:hypothetical protein
MEFQCTDGSLCAGVKSVSTGSAVCWASGRSEAEEWANARAIANALNAAYRASLADAREGV